MKKILTFALVLVTLMVVAGCSNKTEESNLHKEENLIMPEGETNELTLDDQSLEEGIKMVMVDGVIYLDSGKESVIEGRCGVFDGRIGSTVEENEKPTVDNQSNFGIGYGYQFALGGTIEININGKWMVFVPETK